MSAKRDSFRYRFRVPALYRDGPDRKDPVDGLWRLQADGNDHEDDDGPVQYNRGGVESAASVIYHGKHQHAFAV